MTTTNVSRLLVRTVRVLDQFTETTGRMVAWLNLPMVVLTCAVVVLRYVFNSGSIALQESVMYLHGTIFMVGMAYTLKHNEHVRVDIFYQRQRPRVQALIDLLGTLFLLGPVVGFIAVQSWGYVADSWAVREVSYEANGLPWVYLLKTLILVMVALLTLQGLAETLRHLGRLLGWPMPGDPAVQEGV